MTNFNATEVLESPIWSDGMAANLVGEDYQLSQPMLNFLAVGDIEELSNVEPVEMLMIVNEIDETSFLLSVVQTRLVSEQIADEEQVKDLKKLENIMSGSAIPWVVLAWKKLF